MWLAYLCHQVECWNCSLINHQTARCKPRPSLFWGISPHGLNQSDIANNTSSAKICPKHFYQSILLCRWLTVEGNAKSGGYQFSGSVLNNPTKFPFRLSWGNINCCFTGIGILRVWRNGRRCSHLFRATAQVPSRHRFSLGLPRHRFSLGLNDRKKGNEENECKGSGALSPDICDALKSMSAPGDFLSATAYSHRGVANPDIGNHPGEWNRLVSTIWHGEWERDVSLYEFCLFLPQTHCRHSSQHWAGTPITWTVSL